MNENSKFEDDIAMLCISVVAVVGITGNGLSLYMTRTRSRFHNAFGILCSSFLVCNLQTIFSLSTWCLIVLGVKSSKLSSPTLFFVRSVGIFVNGAYFGSLFVHFFIAVNRYCAFVYATKYNQMWSETKALIFGIMSWAIGTTISDCSIIFNKNRDYRFFYSRSRVGMICSSIDSSLSVITVLLTVCVDFITLIKIILYQKRLRENSITSTGESIISRGVLFFKQTCVISLIYLCYVFTMIIHPYVFADKWLLFATSTLSWILVGCLDGLTFLVFNYKLICRINSATTVTPILATNMD